MTRPNGVRRILNNAAHRALAAGPPTKAQEARWTRAWLVAVVVGVVGIVSGRRLSR